MNILLKRYVLITILAVCSFSFAATTAVASDNISPTEAVDSHELSVYPPVPGLDPSPHYRFRVRQVESDDWLEPFAWFTDTPRFDEVGDNNKWYSDRIGGWSHTYSNFEMAEGVMVEVEITRLDPETGEPVDIQSATPHPRRKVRSWRVEDGKAYVIGLMR